MCVCIICNSVVIKVSNLFLGFIHKIDLWFKLNNNDDIAKNQLINNRYIYVLHKYYT